MTRVATRHRPARVRALAAALMLAAAAIPAQAEPDMASIQAQIDQMKADYEARIAALEARFEAAEGRADAATADAPPAAAAADAPADPSIEVAANEAPVETPDYSAAPIVSANAQNPGISVILNGNYRIMISANTPPKTVLHRYMTAGPAAIRTALRSLVSRAIRSPVLQRRYQLGSSRVSCA